MTGVSDGYVPGWTEPLTDIICLLSLSTAPSFCTSGVGILGLPLAFICPLILFEPKSKTQHGARYSLTVQTDLKCGTIDITGHYKRHDRFSYT